MPAVPSRFLSIATPFVAPFSAPARPCHPAYIARRDTQAHMRANNAELIQKVANSIHEGYGDWKNNLSTYQKPVANHFVSGLVRNTLDTVLCKAIVAHTNQPKVQQVLTQISKTLGLAAQISVLAPGAFSPKMAAIIGVGVRSATRCGRLPVYWVMFTLQNHCLPFLVAINWPWPHSSHRSQGPMQAPHWQIQCINQPRAPCNSSRPKRNPTAKQVNN